ncbi:MAG TPA: hypothetical protein ENI61_03640 [Ignavibacteria bacterium]|nr:hypothetical protein [Ignavibacteria bacterium]
MKTIDKIILYIDGQMDPNEKLLFEEKLKNSAQLRKELEKYKNFLNELKNLNEVKIDENYFIRTVPNFRETLKKKNQSKFSPEFALGLSALAAVLIVLILVINKPVVFNKPGTSLLTWQLTPNELSEAIKMYGNQINIEYPPQSESAHYDSVLDTLILNELNGTDESKNYIQSYVNIGLNNIIQNMNGKEADRIYKELLNKRIY